MILPLKTKDGVRVRVEADELRISNLIQVLVPSIGDHPGEDVPLYNVSYKMLSKVLAFAKHYNQDPMHAIPIPLHGDTLPVQEWYTDFVSVLRDETLYDLLHAATYMDIEPLQQLLCARIACLIKGKECDEMKQIFGLE